MTGSVNSLLQAGRLLTGAALGAAFYLAVMSLSRTALPGCVTASACQDALASKWAYILGIPVSFAGSVLYGAMLWTSGAFVRRQANMADAAGWTSAVLILFAALWFTGLQALVLKHLCPWCCLAHALAVSGVTLLWLGRRKTPVPGEATTPRKRWIRHLLTTPAILGGGVLLVTGTGTGLSPAAAPGVTRLPAALAGAGSQHIASTVNPDALGFPMLGRSDAPAASILLSDFTCPHCLDLHAAIEALAMGRGHAFRVAVLPAARSPEAAAIQRTMLALWHLDPAKWHTVAAMLSAKQIEVTPEAVEEAAIRLAGADRMAGAVKEAADRIRSQLDTAARLLAEHRNLSGGILPKLIRGDRVLSGAEKDPAKLAAFLADPSAPESPLARNNGGSFRRGSETGPLLTVLNPELDLQAMSPGKPVDVQIKIQNRGNSPLQLGWLETDHGCFVTSLPSEEIRPGGTAVIGMKVHPPAKAGTAVKRSIRIHSNTSGKPGEFVLHSTLAAAAQSSAPLQQPLYTLDKK